MGFHRLVVPVYAGGLRGGDDYINNATAGTPAPADGALGAGLYLGSYFFAQSDQVTGTALNRGLKALAANCDFLDDAVVALDLSLTTFEADLASIAPAGELLIGTAAKPVTFGGAPLSLALGTVGSQLTGIVDFINNKNRVRYLASSATLDDTGLVDYAVYFTSTNFAFTLTAPAGNIGRTILLVDVNGLLDTAVPVTLTPTGGTIEGAVTFPLNQRFGKWLLYCDGANWYVFRAASDRLVPQYMTGPATAAVSASAEAVLVNTAGGVVTATLPPHSDNTNRVIRFKDYTGNLSTNKLTLARNGGTGKIEGVSADFDFEADWGKLAVMSNGIDWIFV